MKLLRITLLGAALALPMLASAGDCDFNGDGTADVGDLNIIVNAVLAGDNTYDLNGDGVVDVTEINMVINAILNPDTPEEGDEEFTVAGVTFKCIYVEGGTFQMGGRDLTGYGYYFNQKSNLPGHEVTLSSFKIMDTEVIQKLYYTFIADTTDCKEGDYYYNNFMKYRSDELPVYFCSWDNAMLFAEKLSEATGRKFRLPTEAEWEFAAKGGNKSNGYLYAGSDNMEEVGNVHFQSSSPYEQTLKVPKTKKPNELGLYDMSGNVDEWCLDEEIRQYTTDPQVNPQHAGGDWSWDTTNRSDYRMTRGGDKDLFPYMWANCTCEGRGSEHRNGSIGSGFRLVLVIE